MVSACSSGIEILNSFSNSMINSTVSNESAPRSFVKLASGVTSDSSTPNLSTIIFLTRFAISDIDNAAWTRLTRWRETLARVFENRDTLARLGEVNSVQVRFGPGYDTAAWYMAAWAANALASVKDVEEQKR